LLDRALQDRQVLMAPVVLTEILSDPKLPAHVSDALLELPLIEVQPGYWQRAGALRAKAWAKRKKARLGDALIAQIKTGRYDLVVMGSRGRGALSASLLGSVSHYALNHSDVPVLSPFNAEQENTSWPT